jgi:hypothetical protein
MVLTVASVTGALGFAIHALSVAVSSAIAFGQP